MIKDTFKNVRVREICANTSKDKAYTKKELTREIVDYLYDNDLIKWTEEIIDGEVLITGVIVIQK